MPYQSQLERMPLGRSWFVVLLVSLFFFYEFGLGTVFNSLSTPIRNSYGLSGVELGFLSSLYFYSDILFLIPAAILLDKYSAKSCIVVALAICSLGIIAVSISDHFYTLACSRLLMGLGGSFSLIGCVRIATNWFPAHKMGVVIGVVIAMGMLGGWFAQHPLSMVVDAAGWREALLYVGLLGVLFTVLILLFVRSAPRNLRALRADQKEALKKMPLKQVLKLGLGNAQTWYCALYVGLINVATFMLGGLWANEYLVHVIPGFTMLKAASVSGMLFIGMIIGYPFWGTFSERLKLRRMPMIIGAVAAIMTILLIILWPGNMVWMAILFFALGFTTSAQTIAYPLVGEINSMQVTSIATSTVSINSLLWGGVIAEPLFGYLMEVASTAMQMPLHAASVYKAAIWIAPVAFLGSLVFAFMIRETHCQRQVD